MVEPQGWGEIRISDVDKGDITSSVIASEATQSVFNPPQMAVFKETPSGALFLPRVSPFSIRRVRLMVSQRS